MRGWLFGTSSHLRRGTRSVRDRCGLAKGRRRSSRSAWSPASSAWVRAFRHPNPQPIFRTFSHHEQVARSGHPGRGLRPGRLRQEGSCSRSRPGSRRRARPGSGPGSGPGPGCRRLGCRSGCPGCLEVSAGPSGPTRESSNEKPPLGAAFLWARAGTISATRRTAVRRRACPSRPCRRCRPRRGWPRPSEPRWRAPRRGSAAPPAGCRSCR